MGVESVKILVCETNGRCIEYVERFGIPDGFKLIDVDDTKGEEAIKQGLIYKDGEFVKNEPTEEEIKKYTLESLDGEYSRKIKDIESEMARTLAIGDNELLEELKEEREELVKEYEEKRGAITND